MLNPAENLKYNRHLLLPEIGETGQMKLKQASVLVVGAGGLGCPVLQYLAAAGVGNIGIIDFDLVDASNLQRQVLYDETDIGKPKAEVAVEKLRRQNSLINIHSHGDRLTTHNVESFFCAADIIIDCTDNFSARYLISDACTLLKKPMVYGSIYRFQGQVSVFNLHDDGPTYRCLFPEPPAPEAILNCSEIGVLGVLPGIIGVIQATEVIKIICGIGDVLSGNVLYFDALSMQFMQIALEKNTETLKNMPTNLEELGQWNYEWECEIEVPCREIEVEELLISLQQNGDFVFIDVRNESELPNIAALNG
ncbi:MAG: HesA/MoeB/ThiF family protein, partial [Saprospiraceae bacterium]